MVNITFEVGGRKVAPDRFASQVEQITKNITNALESVRWYRARPASFHCIKGITLDKLEFAVHGRCEDLTKRTLQQLK